MAKKPSTKTTKSSKSAEAVQPIVVTETLNEEVLFAEAGTITERIEILNDRIVEIILDSCTETGGPQVEPTPEDVAVFERNRVPFKVAFIVGSENQLAIYATTYDGSVGKRLLYAIRPGNVEKTGLYIGNLIDAGYSVILNAGGPIWEYLTSMGYRSMIKAVSPAYCSWFKAVNAKNMIETGVVLHFKEKMMDVAWSEIKNLVLEYVS